MLKHEQHNVKQMAIIGACAVIMAVMLLPAGAVAQDRELTISEVTILNQSGIEIQGNFDLLGGSICSRSGDIVLGGKAKTRMNQGNPIGNPDPSLDTGDTVITESAGGTLELKNFAQFGNQQTVYTNNLTVTGTSGVLPPLPANLNLAAEAICPADPPFPSFTASSDKADDVECTAAGTDIFPGTYRDLIVEFRGKCNFQGPGTYNFRSIQSKVSSTYGLNFLDGQCDAEDGFNINVVAFVTLKEFGSVNSANTPSVFFNVAGQDDPYSAIGSGNPNPDSPFTSQPSAFFYAGDGNFNVCYVFTPNGTTALHGKSDTIWNAQWVNKYIFEDSTLRIRTKVGVDYEDCCEIKFDCACISEFVDKDDKDKEVQVGDTLQIKGKGFNTKNVEKVLFFDVSAPIADLTDPGASAVCEQATINFIDLEKMEVVVPAACPSGDYKLGLRNGGFCYDIDKILTIVP